MKILLIDSNSLVNRAFHALPPMQNTEGLFTNAIYGYITMLNRLISAEKPTHICAAFDCRAKTFRHLKYDGYKAQRKPMPEELAMQIPVLQELLTKMGIKIVKIEGIEADDIIGTLAKRFDVPTIIVSGDKDCLQLIDDSTTVLSTRVGVTNVKRYDLETLKAEGFTPQQIIEYKGLAGDSSDNIPGCAGVGEKTATDLLSRYGDIDGIYKNIEEIKGKLKEKLIENRETVYLSRELATICTTCDIDCDLEEMVFENELGESAKYLMQKLGFSAVIDKFNFKTEDNNVPVQIANEIKAERIIVENRDALRAEIAKIPMNAKVAFSRAEDIGIAYNSTEIIVKISQNLLGEGLYEDEILHEIAPIFTRKTIVFDAKEKKHFLARYGIALSDFDDLLLKSYLVNSVNIPKDEVSLLKDYGFSCKNTCAEMLSLNDILSKKLAEKNLTNLYENIELPLVNCLFDMERTGFNVDIKVLDEIKKQYFGELEELTAKIYELCGVEFNINSPRQLAEVLFNKLNLPQSKRNKTSFTVNAEVLEELEHPVIPYILQYRVYSKLISTYLDGMRPLIDKNNKVHTVFKQCLTSTGRLSSTEPNLQNIPVRRAEGKEIRRMFIPSEGSILITADYSQIELRLLAHFSQDPVLIEAFNAGDDIHALTASRIFKIPLAEVTSEMRSKAKAVNFGIIYGISNFGLAKNANVSAKAAREFIADYFVTYPRVKEYMDKNVAEVKKNGYLSTIFGRIRAFPEITSPKYAIRAFGERAAMNFPLQGSASDIIKAGMNNIYAEFSKRNLQSKMILQVHDEIIVDAVFSEILEVKAILSRCMENAACLRVPLTINLGEGKNWYEAK